MTQVLPHFYETRHPTVDPDDDGLVHVSLRYPFAIALCGKRLRGEFVWDPDPSEECVVCLHIWRNR